MIEVTADPNNNLIHLVYDGEINSADIEKIDSIFDEMVNASDKIPSVVAVVEKVKGWENLEAFRDHFNFGKKFQKLVPRIAIVTDSWFIGAMKNLGGIFVKAEILHFPKKRIDAAVEWASHLDEGAGKIEPIDGLPADVLGYRFEGIVGGVNYEETLTPAIEEKLKTHDKIKLLAVFGDDFQSYTTSGVWNDTRLGLSHFADFRRIAVVSDNALISNSLKAFGWMIPGEVAVFELDDFDDAKEWIKT